MGFFKKYLLILCKPLYVSLTICLSFAIVYAVLIFLSNEQISLFVQKVITGDGNYTVAIRFKIPKIQKGDIEKIIEIKDISASDFQYHSVKENITYVVANSHFYEREKKILSNEPDGIVVDSGYKELYKTDFVVANGRELHIAGESVLRRIEEIDSSLRFYVMPAIFEELEPKDTRVNLYVNGFPNYIKLKSIIEEIQSKGVVLEQISIENFEGEVLQNLKLELLGLVFIVFLFLLFNILIIFHYILYTRKKILSIFRILGLSKRRAVRLIAEELLLLSVIGFAIAFITTYVVSGGYSVYFKITDIMIFFILASITIYISATLLAMQSLNKYKLYQVKENFDA